MTKIIAELCQNHNGDKNILDEMVSAAAENGASYAKIQSMHSSELTHRERFDQGLIEGGKVKIIKRPYKDEYERLKKLDLELEDHSLFLNLCKKYKIIPCTTIFSLSKIKMISDLKFETIKIASFDCASHRLIEEITKFNFKYIIVSTGATYNREIKKTASILRERKKQFTLLHCISIYPTPLIEGHLERINYLKRFSNSVGLSDHSNPEIDHNILSAMAMTYEIDFIEKHFTVLDKDKSKDGPVSVNPSQLKELSNLTKFSKEQLLDYVKDKNVDYEILKGMANRDLSDLELLNRDYYQGRFASKNKRNKIVFNWDKESEF
tara:strand:- start:2996 stop:3961 length:966 start_codon:yes stop_codon:yes gene_type:complete